MKCGFGTVAALLTDRLANVITDWEGIADAVSNGYNLYRWPEGMATFETSALRQRSDFRRRVAYCKEPTRDRFAACLHVLLPALTLLNQGVEGERVHHGNAALSPWLSQQQSPVCLGSRGAPVS